MTTDISEHGLESLICTALAGDPNVATHSGNSGDRPATYSAGWLRGDPPIADAVTGNLDVREAASQQPEEADDHDFIDDGFPLTDDMGDRRYSADNEATGKPVMESVVTE